MNGAVHSIATTNIDCNKAMSLFKQTQAQCNLIVCGDIASLLPKEGSDEWKQLAAEGLKLKQQFQDGVGAVANTDQVSISHENFESFKEKHAKNSKPFQDFMVSVNERFTGVEKKVHDLGVKFHGFQSEFNEFKHTVANTDPLDVDLNPSPPANANNLLDPNAAPPAKVNQLAIVDSNKAPPGKVDPLANVDPNATEVNLLANVDWNAAPPAKVDRLVNVDPHVEPNLDLNASAHQTKTRTKAKLFVVVLLLVLVCWSMCLKWHFCQFYYQMWCILYHGWY